jgi:hypothetical protein
MVERWSSFGSGGSLMTASRHFSPLQVIFAIFIAGAVASSLSARAAPPPEGGTAAGGVASQSGNCSTAQPDHEGCLPGGPSASNGQPVPTPIVPPGTPPASPPVTPPITPPSFTLTPGHIDPQASPPDDPHSAQFITGWAKARLHIKGDDQDITYESDRVNLLFWKRNIQDMPGNTQYVLYPAPTGRDGEQKPLSMTWTGRGKVFDCTVEGQATVTFPIDVDSSSGHGIVPGLNSSLDPTRPAYGYLNVVGPDGGDFHSVIVTAFNPDARLKKTCPGDPPTVTEDLFEAGYLLHIVFRKNMYEERGLLVLSGMQVLNVGRPDAILDMLPPGPARDVARQALSQAQASTSGTSRLYTWEWALYPFGNYDAGLGQPP